ncbi:mandelate racemase/muconate lactonizing enzyme family protein [Caenimonas sedimenti]|uniref:Mandelate racemase/muconate lactonizing enzyme family protein n=1 Tax=Caenimonas sedimenti TaxID=2596921 RepID=A0A562ZNG8_9BURK|nr:mandelate racemase/muconate lactonizing enzyme family protein [Caenimonas sedimenti]TWO69906.1 mandelate racemase/muconate lactonizing enzyme family protein [Caenimonas sedimenti]
MAAVESNIVSYAQVGAGARTAADSADRIDWIQLSLIYLPLATPVSDAKVLTGVQKPLTEIAFVFCEIRTRDGHEGIGFGYSKRAGGRGVFAHAREIAPNLLGQDPSDIGKLFVQLQWAGASMGRAGMTTQAIAPFDIALWDLKAKRAKLPLAKLLGAHRDSVQCYNTSGGYLHTELPQVLKNVATSRESGIGGIKIKVGQPDLSIDVRRVGEVRKLLGDGFPLMVDANQQWDRQKATRACRAFEGFDLTWIEEPLDAHDHEGHGQLADRFDTAIATGEMLTSFEEHAHLIMAGTDFIQPDAPRVGGITPFLKIMALGEFKQRKLAPHFAMEIHLHLAAAYGIEPWLEHFEWLGPLFNEQLQLKDGRMWVPDRPGLGFSLSEQAIRWRADLAEFGQRP